MKNKVFIRDFHNKILGSIETLDNGNKIVRDFYNKIIGKYDARSDVTRDFYGKIVGRGDQCTMLIGLASHNN